MAIENPIPRSTRGKIYIVGIVAGAVGMAGAAVLTVLGLNEWQPVLVAAVSAVTVATSTLARDNLDNPYPNGGDPGYDTYQ